MKRKALAKFSLDLPPPDPAWIEAAKKTIDARLKVIMANRERLIEAFIAETGLPPSECELVETHAGFTTIVRMRRRGEP